jgi:very-short-patch-repair endonuclease
MRKTKEGGWFCSSCGELFKTRKLLQEHHKICFLWLKRGGRNQYIKAKELGLEVPKEYIGHPKNWLGKKHTEETKKKISESMKKAHAEGRAHNIGECRWNNKPSYPEQWFIKIIENENLDKEYIREMPFHRFSLDFAWPKKKVCLEIDGEQHDKFEDQRKRDCEKDKLLREEGWLELRASWIWICNNTKEFISSIKKLLERQLPVEEIEAMKIFLLSRREKLKLANYDRQKRIDKAKKNGTLTKDGKLSGNKLSFDELNRRKEIILNCGVDLTKYGCL